MALQSTEFPLMFSIPGVLTVGEETLHYIAPYACEVNLVQAAVDTAPVGASLIIDVLKNDVGIFTGVNLGRNPIITTTKKVSQAVSAVRAVPASTTVLGLAGAQYSPGTNNIGPFTSDGTTLLSLAAGDTLSVGLTQIGSTTAGSDMTVSMVLIKK